MKKITLIISVVLLSGLMWYVFIKPYDYLVRFKITANAGTINQTLKSWNTRLDNTQPIQQKNVKHLIQNITKNDSIYSYNWKIEDLTDSTSFVRVYVKDLKHSIKNKISIPFIDTNFEKGVKQTVNDFVETLKNHTKNIKIKIIGKGETKSTYCAFVELKGVQIEKAKGMMKNYNFLNTVLFGNGVKSNGPPFIEITNWNIENDSIKYNFCFPILETDSLPKHELIKYKEYKSVKAIKAIYNGNYITSDRAWYQLLEYAERNNIQVINKPVELFFSNPNYGGNELDWIAEIYMPLKNQ